MHEPFKITAPVATSQEPDKYTRQADLTGPNADGRVLSINLLFFRYGTDDKLHAASIISSFILLFMIAGLVLLGNQLEVFDKVFNWLGSAYLFVTGVALGGKSSNEKKKDNIED